MCYNAKNCSIEIGDTTIDYISFGNGDKNLVIIPGLGDALKNVKGTARTLALLYKQFTKDYKVYMFSRKNKLQEGYSTRDMARDMADVLTRLDITDCHVLGISQGGMISQYLAIDYPHLVKKLVLAVTLCKPYDCTKSVLTKWIEYAKNNDYKSIFIDTSEKTYTEKKLKLYRKFYSALSKFTAPKSFDNFIIQANSCLNHNSSKEIGKISCPTFVIGGDQDKIVGETSSFDIAQLIVGSRLKIYNGLGHGAYIEAKDFDQLVLDFFNE